MAAYHFLCVNYATGDEIILIGFSRGAFTVRYLIKLVQELGLLAGLELGDLHEIFGRWWKTASVRGNVSLNQEGDHPRNRPQIPIKACGLWDTVNSVWSTDLQTEIMGVEHVFHALSLHEHRYDFQVVMASVPDGEQHLEQCWFSGYHGDVGGGREDDALAHLALAWMMGKLDRLIDFNKLAFYQKEMVNSRWRAVLNRDGRRLTSIAPDSRTLGWRVWETMALPFRKIMNVYRRPGITVPDIHEYIHRSVWKLTSQHSEFLKPCWALKGVTPEDPTNGVRHWTPRESLRRMQESARCDAECLMVQLWVDTVLKAAQDHAEAGQDEDRKNLLISFQNGPGVDDDHGIVAGQGTVLSRYLLGTSARFAERVRRRSI